MKSETLFAISLILLLAYFGQIILAMLNATNRPSAGGKSILGRLFVGKNEFTSTWVTFGIIFMIPVLISWLSAVSDALLDLDNNLALFNACTSMLLVLITLELSQINDTNHRNRNPWRGLLLLALCLDILTLLFLYLGVKNYVYATDISRWSEVFAIVSRLGGAAFFASFAVILFARKAGEVENENE